MSDTDQTKTVNLKNMHAGDWQLAKQTADRNGESLAEFLSRAIRRLAEAEAGGRQLIMPPAGATLTLPGPATRPAVSVIEALSFMVEAGIPIQKRVGRQLNRLVHDGLAGQQNGDSR